MSSKSDRNEVDASKQSLLSKAAEAKISMSSNIEHKRILQSILTNEVDPQHNDFVHTSENGIEVQSTSELGPETIAQKNEFENAFTETTRHIRVLCLRC